MQCVRSLCYTYSEDCLYFMAENCASMLTLVLRLLGDGRKLTKGSPDSPGGLPFFQLRARHSLRSLVPFFQLSACHPLRSLDPFRLLQDGQLDITRIFWGLSTSPEGFLSAYI